MMTKHRVFHNRLSRANRLEEIPKVRLHFVAGNTAIADSFQCRLPPIAIGRFGGWLMPVTYCIPLIRWTSKSPATPVPYSFQQRQRANIRGSNARLGTLPCQISQSRV